MTIAVSCCLADGAIIGADSATTIFASPGNVAKVYNDAEKIFPLFSLDVGLVAYGVAALGQRTIRSYALEFEVENRTEDVAELTLETLATKLWEFFRKRYDEEIGPALENQRETPYDQIPPEQRPFFGLHLVGYSLESYLPEAFEILPMIPESRSAIRRLRAPGEFGANWAGQYDGIARLHHGYDGALLEDVIMTVLEETSEDDNPNVDDALRAAINRVLGQAPEGRTFPSNASPTRSRLCEIPARHHDSTTPFCNGSTHLW